MIKYKYGMRERGFSIGCQPKNGLVDWKDVDGEYYSILWYSRKLEDEEVEHFSLVFIGEEKGEINY